MAAHDGVLVVGIGSGKSTVVRNLLALLQPPTDAAAAAASPIASVDVVHQDDFCPPQDQMPRNEKWGVTDWDTPHGSSDYRRLEQVIQHFLTHAQLPADFESHEYRRSNYQCTLPPDVLETWRAKFHARPTTSLCTAHGGQRAERVHVLIVEGFLTFFDTRVCNLFDVRLFLRISKALVKKRREERANYVLDDGQVWEDPPYYFDEIVWPAYLEAHARMFADGDVEKGAPISTATRTHDGGPVPRLEVIEAENRSTTEVVQDACTAIYRYGWQRT